MDSGLVLRPSQETDIPAITAIYADAVLHSPASFETEPPSEDVMAERRRFLVERGFPSIVAEWNGRLVGYAYAGPYRPRQAYRWTVEDSLCVAPDAREQGVGRKQLSRLIADSKALGFRLMVAVIGDEASAGSIALHHAFGFRQVGRFEGIGYKHERARYGAYAAAAGGGDGDRSHR